ncbi:hypothetical protein HYPSUDRAFT_957924 [Hypholoma sublateritium FD-334 SS-4]|uniref:Uncharacterized protein n=1 Tax=Hypholoma sublateritium (strain FD-334 SS-4) TaxID=945553 RepID=A0A0D2KUR0_HYPSF|nr:hypothetical protein HYPSUDRAFT_957924 [Hypholoma sublateritium FD-334 SS-4]
MYLAATCSIKQRKGSEFHYKPTLIPTTLAMVAPSSESTTSVHDALAQQELVASEVLVQPIVPITDGGDKDTATDNEGSDGDVGSGDDSSDSGSDSDPGFRNQEEGDDVAPVWEGYGARGKILPVSNADPSFKLPSPPSRAIFSNLSLIFSP